MSDKTLAYLFFISGFFVGGTVIGHRFLEWARFQSLGTRDFIVEKLGHMFIEVDAQQVLMGQIALTVLPGIAVFFLVAPHWVPALVLGLTASFLGWKAPRPIVEFLYQRRVEQFTLQMVDGLNLMANGLKSGLSVVQSMALVTEEMPKPIKQEFGLILSQNKLGVPLEEAFNNLALRVKSDDVEMFVTSVNILKETGGNLAETFDTITTTIRERIKLSKKIKALTAAGFNQGIIVMLIGPGMVVSMAQSDPELMEPMFTHPIGWAMLFVAAMLQVIGFFVVMRIVKIEV